MALYTEPSDVSLQNELYDEVDEGGNTNWAAVRERALYLLGGDEEKADQAMAQLKKDLSLQATPTAGSKKNSY